MRFIAYLESVVSRGVNKYIVTKNKKPHIIFLSTSNSQHSNSFTKLSNNFLPIHTDKLLKLYQDANAEYIDSLQADFERLDDGTAQAIDRKYNLGILNPTA